jgi:hypothetical protein
LLLLELYQTLPKKAEAGPIAFADFASLPPRISLGLIPISYFTNQSGKLWEKS